MTPKTLSFAFDRDAVWKKVRDRKPVALDMNCWINMGDDKSTLATQVKGTLRRLVSEGQIFCPLSFGLIVELYKQEVDSMLRVGTLMEELSLSVSYASREEIFAWEVERAIRRLADAGPIDLSLDGLYVPVLAYLDSHFRLEFPEGFPSEHIDEFAKKVKAGVESMTFTELLKMRANSERDTMFEYVKSIPAPKYPDEAILTWSKGDRQKIQRVEAEAVYKRHIHPAIIKLPMDVQLKLLSYNSTASKDKYGGVLGHLLEHLPSINNHIELMAAMMKQPSRKPKINDFFDNEIIPVPLAYASVFVAQDKGIRDTLKNRTNILKRTTFHYCYDLAELDLWLKAEGMVAA
jgi:hypothetical protein